MGLFADPAGFDGAGQPIDRRVRGPVGEIVLALAGRAMFPDEPDFLARQVLGSHIVDTLRRSVCDPHANRGEAGRELAFGSAPPTDLAPFCCLQRGLCRYRGDVGYRVLSRASAIGNGKDHADVGRVNLLFERDADSPGQAALAQALPEGCRKAISGIGQDTAEANTGGTDPVDLGKRDLGLGAVMSQLFWDPGTIKAGRITRPVLRLGLAAGTAAVLTPGTDLFRLADVRRFAAELGVQALLDDVT